MREEAIRLCWELGDPRGVARTLHYIGEESRDTGDRAGARRAFEESLDVMRELGDKSFVMASLHGLGDLELDSENLSAASERYRESLALALELDTPNVVLLTLAGLASVAAASGDLTRAGHLWATVESHGASGAACGFFPSSVSGTSERSTHMSRTRPSSQRWPKGKSSPKPTPSTRRSHRADPARDRPVGMTRDGAARRTVASCPMPSQRQGT